MESNLRRQRTLCAPIYLHHQHSKFWEIKLNVRTCETTVRVGKLIENDYEDPNSIKEIEKVHEDLETAMQYMDTLVSMKEKKGYEPIEKKINPAKARKSLEKNPKESLITRT